MSEITTQADRRLSDIVGEFEASIHAVRKTLNRAIVTAQSTIAYHEHDAKDSEPDPRRARKIARQLRKVLREVEFLGALVVDLRKLDKEGAT
jgi:tRNA U34 5-carboxymethylaminomethyl modifying GTPase MnmE/TrmE